MSLTLKKNIFFFLFGVICLQVIMSATIPWTQCKREWSSERKQKQKKVWAEKSEHSYYYYF